MEDNEIKALGNKKYRAVKFGIIGCSAGSLFVFKGKYKAVLINYPNKTEKEKLIRNIKL